MKRTLGFFLALLMLLSAVPAFAADTSVWKVKEYVDEFDEPTGEKYIVGGPFRGDFSDSATTDSELEAYIFFDGTQSWLRLFEYGEHQTKNPFSEPQEYLVGIKADLWEATTGNYSHKYVFRCKGFIPGNDDDLYIGSGMYSDFYSDDYEINFGGVEVDYTRYNTFDDVLGRSQKIIFSIKQEGGMNEYLFTVNDASSFSEIAKSAFDKDYIEVLPDPAAEYGASIGSVVIHEENGEGTIVDLYNGSAFNSVTEQMENHIFVTIKYNSGNETTLALDMAIKAGKLTVK